MTKRLLGINPSSGVRTYHEYDHSTGKTSIHEEQDVEKILEYTKRLANDRSYKQEGIKSDWYHFATVPFVILQKIKNEYGFDHRQQDDLPHIERILKTEYKKFLTVDKI